MATIQCGTTQFPAIQAVLFDKDGTLADSREYLRNLGQKRARLIDSQIPGVQEPLLMAFGLDRDRLDLAGLMAVGTRRENEIAAAAYVAETGRGWLEALSTVRSSFAEADRVFQRKADHTPLFPRIRELLQQLAAAEIKLGIVSADSSAGVEDFVDRWDLGALISVCLGTDDRPSKPDPTLLYAACEALGVAPEATLVIGDSSADIEMAIAAGAASIGVTWGGTNSSSFKQAGAIATQVAEIQVLADLG
jgi:phosphoglycolate phosphatase